MSDKLPQTFKDGNMTFNKILPALVILGIAWVMSEVNAMSTKISTMGVEISYMKKSIDKFQDTMLPSAQFQSEISRLDRVIIGCKKDLDKLTQHVYNIKQ